MYDLPSTSSVNPHIAQGHSSTLQCSSKSCTDASTTSWPSIFSLRALGGSRQSGHSTWTTTQTIKCIADREELAVQEGRMVRIGPTRQVPHPTGKTGKTHTECIRIMKGASSLNTTLIKLAVSKRPSTSFKYFICYPMQETKSYEQ